MRSCRRCGCTDEDCRGCIERTGEPCSWVTEDLCSACHSLGLPHDMSPAIAEVLGIMCFQAGPLAEVYRAAGHPIKRKAEAEQAFILWRFLPLAILHGDAWREHSNRDLDAQLAAIAATRLDEANEA